MRGDVHRQRAPKNSKGREQQSSRYAVVVQSDLLLLSTILVAPTSTSASPASFRPEIVVAGTSTRVLVEQTVAVDPTRLGDIVAHLARAELDEVDAALQTVLDVGRR